MIDPPHTEVHNERTVYDGEPWLTVTRSEITTPDGVDRVHHAVRLNSVATVTLVDEHGRALLLRRHRWIVQQVGFESPGGIMEPSEDPEACARRELLEETGFEAGHLTLVADLEPMPGLVETRHFVFVGRDPRQLGPPVDAEEAGQLIWVPLGGTSDLLTKGQLLGTGTAVGMLSAAALYAGLQLADSPGQQVVTPPQAS
ncbi:NUDIX hydrolase [Nocardia sp. CA-129566]|uniref:NUDIX hydrolase n=1 Tax=Nocardia sp. CA-129566 TaxID=3239976 RepID=UPI003D97625F